MNTNVILKHFSRFALIFIGALLIINTAIYLFSANASVGCMLTLFFGIALVLSGIFLFKDACKPVKAVLPLLLVVFCIFTVFSSVLCIKGSIDTSDYGEDVLIVLGCGVKGDVPGDSLKARLDKALLYHEKNPDAIILVSGGQGSDEKKSEAFVMKKYLSEHGVDPDIIITEDRSTSTEENFEFSKIILDEYFDSDYTVAFVTNEFHISRASAFAKLEGFENATHVHADTPFYALIPSVFRECTAVVKLYLVDQFTQ